MTTKEKQEEQDAINEMDRLFKKPGTLISKKKFQKKLQDAYPYIHNIDTKKIRLLVKLIESSAIYRDRLSKRLFDEVERYESSACETRHMLIGEEIFRILHELPMENKMHMNLIKEILKELGQ